MSAELLNNLVFSGSYMISVASSERTIAPVSLCGYLECIVSVYSTVQYVKDVSCLRFPAPLHWNNALYPLLSYCATGGHGDHLGSVTFVMQDKREGHPS